VKCKTCHGKSEEKGEFGSPWSGFLGLKGGTPIILRPNNLFPSEVGNICLLKGNVGFLGVFEGIKLKIEKWKFTNQLLVSCSNSSHSAFAMGKFLNVCNHWCSNAL
jgi:hypothetical protein